MSEKRDYQIINCLISVDLHANAVVPGARTRVGGGHDGKQDLGHVCKTIFNYDNFCLLWVVQEVGVDSPYDNYVRHPGCDEIEFVISGACEFGWPGERRWFKPGIAFNPLRNIPHLNNMRGILEPLNLLVFYDRPIEKVKRVEFNENEKYTGDGSYPYVDVYETPAQEIEPGHFRLITCNEALATSSTYQYLKPGVSVPQADFITHDTDEIIFILSGTGIATYPDKTYRLRPQIAIYNPAGTPHKYWNDGTEDLKALVLYTKNKVENVKTEKKAFTF